MNVQKKYATWSVDRRLAAGILEEMVREFKACTMQSEKQVDTTIDSEEHVDARNWLRNDTTEHVDAICDSEKLVVDGSDPKSDPIVKTHTTNVISTTHSTNGISTQTLLINQTIQAVVQLITPLVTDEVEVAQESLSRRQANVTDVARPCTFILRTTAKVIGTKRDRTTPRDASSSKTRYRASCQSPTFVSTSDLQHGLGIKIFSVQTTPVSQEGAGTQSHTTLPLMDFRP